MLSQALTIARVAIPFTWLGAVLAISFLEAPIKFRAPGITVPLGLGIGRLVFRALNVAELVLAALLTATLLLSATTPPSAAVALTVAAWAALLVQVAGLRPALDRRAKVLLAGDTPPPSRLHLAYIVLEIAKVGILLTLGCLLVAGLTA